MSHCGWGQGLGGDIEKVKIKFKLSGEMTKTIIWIF